MGTPTACPSCSTALVSPRPASLPWCPGCGWNLDVHDPAVTPWRGSRWMGRWGFRRGRAVDAGALRELLAGPDAARSRWGTGERWLLGASVVILLLAVAAVAWVVWVLAGTDLPLGVRLLGALPGVGLLALLRPTLGRVPRSLVVTEEEAPQLHALVRRLASAVGAPPPDLVAVSMDVNAGVAHLGLRQRSVLVLGMPFWLVVSPAGRLGVLAHEMGHLANGDPRRSTATLPARAFGARFVEATGGSNPWRRAAEGIHSAADHGLGLVGLVLHTTIALVNSAGATVQLLVDSVSMPDSRRAEYRADLAARRAVGSEASLEASAGALVADRVWQDLWHVAPRLAPEGLEAAAALAREREWREVTLLRALSRRSVDLWSTHPCEDDRMRLVEALPRVQGEIGVGDVDWAALDTELAPWRTRAHRALLGTRDRF